MADESPILVMARIGGALIPDAGLAERQAIGSSDEAVRRSYVHAVFAMVEGLNYARLVVSTESTHLSEAARNQAELAVRLEKHALKDADDGGIPSSTRKSFAAFAAAHGVPNPLQTSGDDWAAFLAAVSLRNRITHPRCGADCRVSANDFAVVQRAHHWYQESDQHLLASAQGDARHGA